MTLERQTEDGSEVVSVADLTLGDNVRCLFAPKGPRTVAPELGWCKFEVRGHNSNSSMMYEQLLFLDDQGEERMIAATGSHMLWRSTDTTLKGTVDPKKISLQNESLSLFTLLLFLSLSLPPSPSLSSRFLVL